jgi:hypothetical protein
LHGIHFHPVAWLQALISTLEEAKSKAVEITVKIAKAEATAAQLEEARGRHALQ